MSLVICVISALRRRNDSNLEAIAAHDPEAAERAMGEHVERSRTRLIEMLERATTDGQVAY